MNTNTTIRLGIYFKEIMNIRLQKVNAGKTIKTYVHWHFRTKKELITQSLGLAECRDHMMNVMDCRHQAYNCRPWPVPFSSQW